MLVVWLQRLRAAGACDGWRESGTVIAAARSLASRAKKGASNSASVQSAVDLHQALSNAGLSYNATMAVMRAVGRRSDARPTASSSVLARVQELQQGFGAQVVSAMLAREPSLLQRKPATLQANYAGLLQRLPFEEEETRRLCVRCPMLLSQNPATVATRLSKLQAMLQVDKESMQALVCRMPGVLKLNVERLAGTVAFLEQAAGVDRARIVRMMLSWPMLGSVGLETLRARHKSIAQLLGGSSSDIKRVLASWPNLLVRDHHGLADKMAHLAEVLGLSREDMCAVMLKEPGLLSYNVGTLKSKYAYITQVLRLPRERALTLLTHNRPLIGRPPGHATRVQVLCKLLGVPEDKVYPLLHQHMSVLRFQPETMEAKLAVVASLCALNPSWQQQWAQSNPMLRLRAIQAGWSTIYRLVFLLHTAQAESAAVMTVLRAVRATRGLMHPDYMPWLGRYNQAIAAQGHQVQQLPLNGGPLSHNKGPATVSCVYEPIPLNTVQGWHAGSLFHQGLQPPHASTPSVDHPLLNSPPSSSTEPQPIQQSGQQGWEAGSSASSTTLRSESNVILMDDAAAAPHSTSRTSMVTASSATAQGAAAAAAITGAEVAATAVPATRAHLLAHVLSTSAAKASELMIREPALGRLSWGVLCARMGAVAAVLVQLGRVAAGVPINEHHQLAHQHLHHEQLQHQQQQQAQQPPTQPVRLSPPPWADAALSTSTTEPAQPCVTAALAVACHLAPFSAQLWAPPAPQHPAVAQLVLLRPLLMRSTTLAQRAAWLQSLAAAHAAVAAHLQALAPGKLAAALSVPRTRLSMLSFLVQTRQPMPWLVPVERLLTPTERHLSPAAFEAAYPGYAAWKAAWPAAGAATQAAAGELAGGAPSPQRQQRQERRQQGQQKQQGWQGVQQDALHVQHDEHAGSTLDQSALQQDCDEGDEGLEDEASVAERG